MKNVVFLIGILLCTASSFATNHMKLISVHGSRKLMMDTLAISYSNPYSSSNQHMYYVVDTITADTAQLEPHSDYGVYWYGDFIQFKYGDIKHLYTMYGKLLFRTTHCFRTNNADSTITAWICGRGWAFGNVRGDTLFYDPVNTKQIDMNYMPDISREVFCAKLFSPEKNKVCVGYMNQQGTWLIPPIYDTAEEFDKDKTATVVSDGKKMKIDITGKILSSE